MTSPVSSAASYIVNELDNTNNNAHKHAYKRIIQARSWLLLLPFIGLSLQILIDPGRENTVASLLAASGSFLAIYVAFTYKRLTQYPLSTLIVLGFGFILNLVPLLLTTAERKPLIFNLNLPIYTFFHCFLITCVALLAHAAYRKLIILQRVKLFVQSLLIRMRLFDQIAFKEVWLYAIIGFIATYFNRADSLGVGPQITGLPSSPLLKLIEGFKFLTAIPVVYYLQSLWSPRRFSNLGIIRSPLVNVVVYILSLSLVAIATNTRAVVLLPLATLFLGLIMGALYGLFRLKSSILIGVFVALFFMAPLVSDLTSAMRMARGFRGDVSPVDLVFITFDNLQDRDGLRRFQEGVAQSYETSGLWDMSYYDNELINRFANIKVVDQSLELDTEIGPQGRIEMLDHHINRMISVLPTPFITALGFRPELKAETITMSWGDKHLNLALGYPVFSAFRVTHFSGTGMSAFRYAYLLILLPGLLVVFTFADAHCISSSRSNPALPLLSIIGFASLFIWFLIPIRSDLNWFYLFGAREFWEPVLLLFGLRSLMMRV